VTLSDSCFHLFAAGSVSEHLYHCAIQSGWSSTTIQQVQIHKFAQYNGCSFVLTTPFIVIHCYCFWDSTTYISRWVTAPLFIHNYIINLADRLLDCMKFLVMQLHGATGAVCIYPRIATMLANAVQSFSVAGCSFLFVFAAACACASMHVAVTIKIRCQHVSKGFWCHAL
jgi:hypothetical protein